MTRPAVAFPASLVLLLLCATALAGDDDGWERIDAVPAWVLDPPAREGTFAAVDVGLSDQLDLAYDPDRVPRDRLNLRRQIEERLRRLLGDGAREAALAGARAATVVRKAYHHQPAQDPREVGGQVYTAFVLWETPLDAVLERVPEAERAAALVLLRARRPAPAWVEVEADPSWAGDPVVKDGAFLAAAQEHAGRPDLARAIADLRGRGQVRFEIQARLRFQVGNDAAFAAADDAVSYATPRERAWCAAPARAWMRWSVPVERILADVPEAVRPAVEKALAEPIPPAPWTWQAVDAEPAWVASPPHWADHLPYVQAVASEQADVAKQQAARSAEGDVREELERRLQPVVGFDAAARAARAGARARVQGAHAFREREAGTGTARASGTHLVDTWTLWQIPLDKVLDEIDEAHRDEARKALGP